MIVLNDLSKFFSGVWEFLKSTLFSKEWWDKYYWIPVAFLVGLILWILSGGRKNPTEKVVKRLNDIKKSKIKKEATDKESKVESEAKEQKEHIQKEADRKVKDARDKLKKENKKLEDDSEAVNDILNDILD